TNPPTLGNPFLVLTVNVAVPATDPIQPMHFFGADDKDAYPKFPAYLNNLPAPPAGQTRTLTFSSSAGPGPNPNPPQFTIDGRQFGNNPNGDADQCQKVNTTWDWTLANSSKGGNQVHPFHIHINPFQILSVTTPSGTWTPQGPPVWSDVVSIPVNGSVLIRQAFNDFTGTYVLHCHI